MAEHFLLRNRDVPDIADIEVYVQHGGYRALSKVLKELQPDEVGGIVKASGLRGRGGAGFPTGVKWSFIPKGVFPRYVVVNADESEPGTFKDREIIEQNPHQLIEGAAICAYAVQAQAAYVYCRGEFHGPAAGLEKAIADARRRGYLGQNALGSDYSLEIYVHLGAGAYICGEETALLESLEGKIGQPRSRPPFPAAAGLYGKPTVINNVETLTNLPPIIERGPDWYKSIGTEKSPGPKIFCLSGCVQRPGNYELPLGTTFRHLIYDLGGGPPAGRQVKAILPAGASAPFLTAEALDVPMDYESVQEAGSMLGSASIIVLDDSASIPWAVMKTTRFFKHESCGKCTPCREGTYWMAKLAEKIATGRGSRADLDLLQDVAEQIEGKCFCLLGEFAPSAVTSGLKLFREEFEAAVSHSEQGG
jgi:NADH-quinone oxidoreductase subunit F